MNIPVIVGLTMTILGLSAPNTQPMVFEGNTGFLLIKQRDPTPTHYPTPKPTRFAPNTLENSYSSDSFSSLFQTYSAMYGISRENLENLALCESALNPHAQNMEYGGLFQFSTSTWISTRTQMGLHTDPALRYNPEEAIKTTAYKISVSGYGSWPACSRKYSMYD